MEQQTDTGTTGMAVDRFTLTELRKLQADVEQAIRRQRQESRRKALDGIARLIAEAELTPEEVMAHLTAKRPRRKKRSKLPPKYRDPANPEHSWAGRGKRPKWLEARLAAGAKLEDFRITAPGDAQVPEAGAAARTAPLHTGPTPAVGQASPTGQAP